jgi:hypothetical protein
VSSPGSGGPRGSDLLLGAAHHFNRHVGDREMLGTILLIVLVLLLVGALPTWPHSRSWGYYPSGGLGLVLVLVLVLFLMGGL